MTSQRINTTVFGNPVQEHDCDDIIGCELCAQADKDAAHASLEAFRASKKSKPVNPRKRKTVVEDAKVVAARNINHVAGDVPCQGGCGKVRSILSSDSPADWVCNDCRTKPEPTPLQGELDGIGPAHLSDVTVAKGFMLAGNATVTFRSKKTGTRYTYKITRAKCSRCQRTDCKCWNWPRYFVALLSGPDNETDFTYLGMIGEQGRFAATRATGRQEQGAPFKGFRYVWERLMAGQYPDQVEIWHEGRCGRCGRKLTVPESIAAGLGPECATKGGF